MLTDAGREQINGFVSKLTIIWIIMLAMVGLFVAITLLFASPQNRIVLIGIGHYPLLVATLALISVGDIAATYLLNNRFRSAASVERFLRGKGATAIDIAIPDMATLDDDKRAIVLLPHYFQFCMIRWAMIEVVAVYGLALALLTGGRMGPSLFYLTAAVFLGLFRPSVAELEELVATSQGRAGPAA